MDTPSIFRIINAVGLAALFVAVWSLSGTIAEMKTDITWIKQTMKIEHVERK
jgi:hypothetical protein